MFIGYWRSRSLDGQDDALGHDTHPDGWRWEGVILFKPQSAQLARLVGEVGNQAMGTISQKLRLADGSPEKMALHAAVGALQASAAGGNALAGAAGAAAGEYVLTQVSNYLAQHPEFTPSQRNVIQQWAAVVTGGAVGALVGGKGAVQAGAAAALDAERYNRQLHSYETQRIKENSKRSAQQQGIREQKAERRFPQRAFRQMQQT